jgi:hypothetical protein
MRIFIRDQGERKFGTAGNHRYVEDANARSTPSWGQKTIFSRPDRNLLKSRILVPDQGERKFGTAGIHRYVEDAKRTFNAELGPKDHFQQVSKRRPVPAPAPD